MFNLIERSKPLVKGITAIEKTEKYLVVHFVSNFLQGCGVGVGVGVGVGMNFRWSRSQ
jgi:hypothetical protein